MFIRTYEQSGIQRVKANDAAATIIAIAFFLYVTFTSINVMFQAFTKMRLATAADVTARYLATHKGVTVNDVKSKIIDSYVETSFIPTTEYKVGWAREGSNFQTCMQATYNSWSGCTNRLCSDVSCEVYNYREPFVVVIAMEIPPVIDMPVLLRKMTTTVYSISALEIVQ